MNERSEKNNNNLDAVQIRSMIMVNDCRVEVIVRLVHNF